MSYEYTGTIEVTGVPSDEDVIAKAIDYVIKDQEWDEESIELTRDVNRTKHSMDYEGGGDYNEMDGYYNLFYSVGETIIEMYPDCSMIAHFCGTNMAAGTETIYTVQLQNRHVRKIDFEFTGRLDYSKMVGLLCSCDICVNPISHGAAQSIINKVCDYAASGLPVLNTQECQEYRDMLDNYKAGLNCDNGNIQDISAKLERLINDKELRKKLGEGNRRLALEKFDRDKTYKEIIKIVENNR